MKNLHYFIGTKKKPYHLSVGAVLLNKLGEIAVHHFPKGQKNPEFFILARRTLKPNQSLETALARGLKEEFGMKGKPRFYLGSITSQFKNWQGANIQKTTVYFLCDLIPGKTSKATHLETLKGHFGKGSKIEWRKPAFLIRQMKRQAKVMKRGDFDESEIIKKQLTF